ncbi:VOC family protein [Planococcus sp. CP5-4]|uniref:VOC family protein n=1 Tax=unclassified Planococcus (in: firmicutes) TaxID=2662419 RepID=UPI001C23DBB9|nr:MULTISPECIES: VOC family protein [unclassified Planococcus (in: firmicutes)]MBU9674373.1 VOC family protein [Planococcus sp. CP5-4_YE]MBV0909039.1 VOC family protein [Planococcus sp. CP5-4_UN]MBW6065065.1 VOC family protein [Planococcus sp. CP5-4]
MDNTLWINLPVKDLQAAQAFYEQAGFLMAKADSSNAHQAAFYVERQQLYVMLFPQESFKAFTQQDIADASIGSEVLFTLSAKTREEVDNFMFRIEQAGGTVYAPSGERNGMYGAGFSDVDGHRWNFLVMDV